MSRHIPTVVTEGSPFERGVQLGRLAREKIAHTVAVYMRMFEAGAGLDRAHVLARAVTYVSPIEKFAPTLLEEMQGIARGAERDFREIVALNTRTELLYGSSCRRECTAVASTPEAALDRHIRVAQDWDWHPDMAGGLILSVVHRAEGQDVITLTEAGMVGKIGINASGLAMCMNLLTSDWDHAGPAVPMHIILRHILDQATTVAEAIAILQEVPRSTSCNHLLADAGGAIADFEATPGGQRVLRPNSGVLVHANHCTDPVLYPHDTMVLEDRETELRNDRIQLLAEAEPIGEARMFAMLADHETARPICVHKNADDAFIDQVETVAAIVFDLTAGTIDLADGPPCVSEFRRLLISDLLESNN
jgi:isopenicillin-N N-acyltransferase-like protein